jgi:segregation and condensation protein A
MAAVALPALESGIDPPVSTEVYEGPLDLLLVLVRHEGIDIRKVPIARICDVYLRWLEEAERMGTLAIDHAGEYLLMAATLCQLKARELLPRQEREKAAAKDREGEDEGISSREKLVERLLEYERYRQAAEQLGERELVDRDVFCRPPVELALEEQPIAAGIGPMGLGILYLQVMARLGVPDAIHSVEAENLSFSYQARSVLARLSVKAELTLSELLSEIPQKRRRIFLFLAVLEMARLGLLSIQQLLPFGPVTLVAMRSLQEEDLMVLPEAL